MKNFLYLYINTLYVANTQVRVTDFLGPKFNPIKQLSSLLGTHVCKINHIFKLVEYFYWKLSCDI